MLDELAVVNFPRLSVYKASSDLAECKSSTFAMIW
jgi:hypothetical protein